MTFYAARDYREAIKDLMEQRRKLDVKANYQHLAEFMRVPKSYVSKVMLGRANFNSDQLYMVAKYFELNTESREYLELLLEHERCGLAERKKLLREHIQQRQATQLETKKHVHVNVLNDASNHLQEYYLNPYNCIVHMALLLKKFHKNYTHLAKELGISEKVLRDSIASLSRLGIIELTSKGIQVVSETIHLPKDSLLFKAWNAQVRLLSQQRLVQLEANRFYSLSITISTKEEDRLKIQELFMNFLKQVEKISRTREPEQILQLNFDLFPWLTCPSSTFRTLNS